MADISGLLKSISQELRKAQNAFFNRKFDEALALAEGIAATIESAKAQDPAHVQLKTYENQLAKLRKDVASRSGRAAAAAPAAPAAPAVAKSAATPVAPAAPGAPQAPAPPAEKAPTPPAAPAAPQAAPPQPPKLPAGVAKRLRDTRDFLARGRVSDAAAVFAEIEAAYGGQFDPSNADYLAVKELLAQAQAQQAEAEKAKQAAAEAETQRRETLRRQSEERETKLRAFAPHGTPPFGHRTGSVQDLLAQAEAYAQALPVWESFKHEEFPFGKTDTLTALENGLASTFEEFPAFLEQMKAARFDDTLAYLRSRLDALSRDVEGKPAIMSEGSIREAEERLAQVQPLFAGDASRWTPLCGALDEVKAKNAANRAARAKLIFIRPDAYKGDDAPQIKERAERFIREADPAAQVLRTVVYSDDWKELTQWEDYAGTPRLVTRREIHAQVAATVSAACRLFTVYITKELRSDQTWSALAGNVMFADEIDPSNVSQ
jgi:hypothetical protein